MCTVAPKGGKTQLSKKEKVHEMTDSLLQRRRKLCHVANPIYLLMFINSYYTHYPQGNVQ